MIGPEQSEAHPAALDPVMLAVLNGRLVQIADEMDATLYRSAFNPAPAIRSDLERATYGLLKAGSGSAAGIAGVARTSFTGARNRLGSWRKKVVGSNKVDAQL